MHQINSLVVFPLELLDLLSKPPTSYAFFIYNPGEIPKIKNNAPYDDPYCQINNKKIKNTFKIPTINKTPLPNKVLLLDLVYY